MGFDAVAAEGLSGLRQVVELLEEINTKLDALLTEPAPMLTIPEAAAVLGLTEQGVYYHVRNGNLRGIMRSHKWHFTQKQVAALGARLRAPS
jgi:hypothetical protein